MGASENFNLERCLLEIEDRVDDIKSTLAIVISKAAHEIKEVIEFEENNMKIKEEICMSDLLFEVVE